MKTKYKVAMAAIASAALGGLAVHALNAQAKPPVYLVVEIDVTDPDAYAKEFATKMQPLIKSYGGRQLAIGGSGGAGAARITALYGEAPKRAAVQVWESMEKVQAYQNDPQEIWSIGQ
jgi:uncharacterized protein (DUF1330 family)